MGHNINLSKYKIRTDLAIESINENMEGITSKVIEQDNIKITHVTIDKEGTKLINKKETNKNRLQSN